MRAHHAFGGLGNGRTAECLSRGPPEIGEPSRDLGRSGQTLELAALNRLRPKSFQTLAIRPSPSSTRRLGPTEAA
jgi:hypothetical protein